MQTSADNISEKVSAPFYATQESAGCDLFILHTVTLKPGESGRISFSNNNGEELTGANLGMKPWQAARIVARSSTWRKKISIHEGLIDADYRGVIHGLVCNNGPTDLELLAGASVCQLLVTRFERLEAFRVSNAIRNGGLGSTGNVLH